MESKKKKTFREKHFLKKPSKNKIAKVDSYLEKAGYTERKETLFKNLLYLSILLTIFVFFGWLFIAKDFNLAYVLEIFAINIFLIFPAIYLGSILVFFIITDLIIDGRKDSIEKVFPEYLQIVSANIRAGLPLDQALWKGIRPGFGILSKEIEIVAKKCMVGDDLSQSLKEFGSKYDSQIIARSINLIVEGIEAGGEMGELLEDTALNLEDIKIRKQSMAASVTFYIIFITFAVIGTAPLLYGVVAQILKIIQNIGSTIDLGSGNSLGIQISQSGISNNHFMVFSIISLFLSSSGAAVITSSIKSGSAKGALKKLPWFWLISISLYLIVNWGLGNLFSTLF